MTRIKGGVTAKKRHKRLLKKTKGFWGSRKNLFKRAHETLLRAMAYAFKGRKLKKRDMRSLFITRIKAAVETHDMKYNKFIHGLKKENVELNRKMLSQIAILDPATFTNIVELSKKSSS